MECAAAAVGIGIGADDLQVERAAAGGVRAANQVDGVLVRRVLHRLAVHFEQEVAGLEAGARRGAVGLDALEMLQRGLRRRRRERQVRDAGHLWPAQHEAVAERTALHDHQTLHCAHHSARHRVPLAGARRRERRLSARAVRCRKCASAASGRRYERQGQPAHAAAAPERRRLPELIARYSDAQVGS